MTLTLNNIDLDIQMALIFWASLSAKQAYI